MDIASLKKIKQITEKNIEDLGKKQDLSSAETKAVKDGFELLDWLDMKIEECEMKENGYSQYSGHEGMQALPRRYAITSYRSYGPRGSYGYPYYPMDEMAYDGGRSYAMNGRSYGPYYGADRRYSRHSINDRAVACLERMMDEASSDYERQEVHRFIEMIRSAE